MPKPYLFSWMALNNDFNAAGRPSRAGTNYSFHKHHFKHRTHVLLCTQETLARAQSLQGLLAADFPSHPVRVCPLDVKINDLETIKTKVEGLLYQYAGYPLDLFFSPGASLMQVSWYICHTTLGLDTRLVQLMRAEHSADPSHPDLLEIRTIPAPQAGTIILRQQLPDIPAAGDKVIVRAQKPAYDMAGLVAGTDGVDAIIYGESGTGKELVARHIHAQSVRRGEAFHTLNCSAFRDDLLESRLFGHKKGAFTGAVQDAAGLFKQADGGMVFLDEIGDISPYMQQLLLRVLQSREITPIGGPTGQVDVRVLAATHRNLYQMCQEGRFRWDLFYRLEVAVIELPPVRSFTEKDKERLIMHFVKMKARQLRKAYTLTFTRPAWQQLLAHPFPGNIREMENLVASLYVLGTAHIGLSGLRGRVRQPGTETPQSLEAAKQAHARKVYAQMQQNKTQTARILGISVNSLKKLLG